ncbi:MAG: ImmA/IrrE family metallo-endopeptidase [Candidatus Brocadiaceae bacterium]|nr:ImmA/IrrE family metallo-endopeptidase [Candidatus Brocadiaceae bacterium]
MDFTKIPEYTVFKIEPLAHQFLLEKYGPIVSIPVDIDFLIEQESNVALDYKANLKDRGVFGVIYKEGRHFKIIIDEWVADKRPNLYRFTVAEELGHLRLHRPLLEQINSVEEAVSLQSWRGYSRIDRNAKRFAAAILMPSPYIEKDSGCIYKELVGRVGFRDPDAIIKYLVDRLRRKYEVSSEAMQHRLGEWPMRITERIQLAINERLDFLPVPPR